MKFKVAEQSPENYCFIYENGYSHKLTVIIKRSCVIRGRPLFVRP